ncbi:MAG TPA: hypothetical protein VFH15_04255 [Pyrinomonadaceae bacterium]|nr:hypothetical protein [Pyrinomonadaceae bacterium]
MPQAHTINWKWGILAALVVTLLGLIPQVFMWGTRGSQWNGSYAELHGDEWVYSAYIQALIDGRPRRSDAYTGRDERPGQAEPESLFSIQFVPSYLIAVPARALGISSSTAFIILGILAPFLSCLAIFWLLATVTHDEKLASAGALIVLSFGALAAGEGLVHLFVSRSNYSFLPFLRRYEPLAPFPLFFVFCTLTWKSLNERNKSLTWALLAGLSMALLIFSYFFLWTSALAWLACLALLWFISNRADLRVGLKAFAIILAVTAAALVPYALLISHRSQTMDAGQKLIPSHAPDLFRVPELLGLAVFALLVFGVKTKRAALRAPATVFAASFALAPFLIFNQQIITGRSLQPFHYEWFIANYLALAALVITSVLLWRGQDQTKPIRYRIAGRIVFVAIWWAAIEVLAPFKVIIRDSQFTDRAAAVGQRLKELSATEAGTTSALDPRPLVLASENKVAVILPTFTSHAVFWAPHFDFLHLAPGESRARFYQYLYYTGVDGEKFRQELSKPSSTFAAATFGHERVIPDLAVQVTPISAAEIAQKVAEYETYRATFTRELALQHVISYLVVPATNGPDLSNLDRWYERDDGELVGDYRLYRLRLRP